MTPQLPYDTAAYLGVHGWQATFTILENAPDKATAERARQEFNGAKLAGAHVMAEHILRQWRERAARDARDGRPMPLTAADVVRITEQMVSESGAG